MPRRAQGPGFAGVLIATLLLVSGGSALAQTVRIPATVGPPTPVVPVPSLPSGPALTSPSLTPSLTPSLAPTLTPQAVPQAAAPRAASPAPAARLVRFRCEVAPQDQSCREPGGGDDGGGDDECSCARDYCYATPAGNRVCEKLQ